VPFESRQACCTAATLLQGETWSRLLVAGPSSRALTLQGFIAKWRYCAAVDPRGTLAHLLYLGYGPPTGPPAQDLFKRVPRRRVDKKADVSSRWVMHNGKGGADPAVQCWNGMHA
jgi:hypothetical protein